MINCLTVLVQDLRRLQRELLLCLEELDSFPSKFQLLSVSWPIDERLLSEIRQLIAVLRARGRQQGSPRTSRRKKEKNRMVINEISICRSNPIDFRKWEAEDTWGQSSLITECWRQSPRVMMGSTVLMGSECCNHLASVC